MASITINPIPNAAIGAAFTVSGTWTGSVSGTMSYKDGTATAVPFPTGATLPTAPVARPWSYTNPGFTAAGTFPIKVTDNTSGATATANVIVVPAATAFNALHAGDAASLTETNGALLTITSAASGGNIQENGVTLPDGGNSAACAYINGTIYGQDAGTGNWYVFNGTVFTQTTTPAGLVFFSGGAGVTIVGLTLSAQSFAALTSGATVGTIQVQTSSGVFNGTYTIGGVNANLFTPSGNTLRTVGTVAAGSYSITIAPNMGGAVGSGTAFGPFLITGNPVGQPVTTFDDEFTTLSLFNTRNTGAGGTWLPTGFAASSTDGFIRNKTWISNPFNPATPEADIYTDVGQGLNINLRTNTNGYGGATALYIGGILSTQAFSQRFGYFECSAAVPAIPGTVFKFELMGTGGEVISVIQVSVASNGATTATALAFTTAGVLIQSFPNTTLNVTPFNTYGVNWQSGTTTFYINRTAIGSVTTPTLPNPMVMQLSYYDFASVAIPAGVLPGTVQIDYVRAWTALPFTVGPSTVIQGITLTGSSVPAGSASGTNVGTIAVQVSGPAFLASSPFVLGGANASNFAINGSHLITNGAITAGQKAITITATMAGAGGSPFSQNFSINVTTVNNAGFFTVTTSGFTDLRGNRWPCRGINSSPGELLDGFSNWQRLLPGMTFVRLVCDSDLINNTSGDVRFTTAKTDAAIAMCVTNNILVEFEDHSDNFGSGGNPGTPNVPWYLSMVAKYKNNPMVFLETPNEPNNQNGNDLIGGQVNLINQVRAAGWVGPIGLMSWGGFDPSQNIAQVMAQVSQSNQIYGTWHNYAFDTSGVDSGIQNFLTNYHLFPVVDEFGGSADGVNEDASGRRTTAEDIAQQQAGRCGAVFFTNVSGTLSDSVFTDASQSAFSDYGSSFVQPWLSGSPVIEP